MSRYAPDEVGLALTLARGTAKARLGRSAQLEQVLPETRALWQQGRLDERRVAAICAWPARLERIERDRRFTELWDGETIPPEDEDDPAPF